MGSEVMAARISYGKGTAAGLTGLLAELAKRRQIQTSPPPGTYDPAIDAQVGQANRGLGDLLSDYVRDYGEPGTALGGRAGEDYATGKAGVQRSLDWGNEDIGTTADRSLADLQRNRARAGEDYTSNVEGLHRNYAQLGSAQTQTARAAGVQRGGALAQALTKRQSNEALDRKPIDTSFARFGQDSAQAEGRLGEDRTRATNQLALGAATDFKALDTSLLRGTEDAATQLARGGRENAAFGLDANAQRFYQANIPLPLPAETPVPKKKKKPASSTTAGRF